MATIQITSKNFAEIVNQGGMLLMVIRDHAMLYSKPGLLPEKTLTALVEQGRKIDMTKLSKGGAVGAEQSASV